MLKTLQNFYKATTSRAWAIGTGNRYLSTLPTPSAGYLVISPSDTTKREIIAYSDTGTDSLGSYVTVTTRGVGGTTEQAHSKNEPVRMNIIAQHYSEVQDEVTDLQGQIDTLVLQNAPNASTTTRGIVLMSTAPSEAGTAIVVATTDPKYTKIDSVPDAFVSVSTGAGDAGSGVVLNASGVLDSSFVNTSLTRTYNYADSPATWTKPTGLRSLFVEIWGAGGGGGNGVSNGNTRGSGSGGGGGGYYSRLFLASELGSTETIIIGAGGAAQTAGGDTTFGSLITAKGGSAGQVGSSLGNTGGAGGGVGLAQSDGGGAGVSKAAGQPSENGGGAGGAANEGAGGAGGQSKNGGGGGGAGGEQANAGGAGGSRTTSTFSTGGGGAGGASGVNGTAGSTFGYGGGGGGGRANGAAGGLAGGGGGGGHGYSSGTAGTGGTGGNGYARLIEFY
jgi:hypothetical protein